MPICLNDEESSCLNFELEQALSRLERSVEANMRQEQDIQRQFRSWQADWSVKRSELTRDLANLDGNLERLRELAPQTPQLSVVAAPDAGQA